MKYLTYLIPLFFLVFSQLPAQAPVAYLRSAQDASVGYSSTPDAYLRSVQQVSVSSSRVMTGHNNVPIFAKSDRLLVPGSVNGVEGFFLMDTGSPALIVHAGLVEEKGQTYDGQAVDGQAVTLHEVTLDQMVYHNQTYAKVQALALDLSHLDNLQEKPLLGLLGKKWLEQQFFVLDFKRDQVLYFSEREKAAWRARTPIAVSPIIWVDHIPVIQLFIHGKTYWFGLDSGSSDNIIDRRMLHRLPAATVTTVGKSSLKTLCDTVVQRADLVSVDGVQFSPEQQPQVASFVVSDLSHIRLPDGETLDGLIGLTLLDGTILSIDYQHAVIKWWALP